MHDMHEATEILLSTARDYGSDKGSARDGDVIAAAYRLVATHVHEHGYADLSRDLEKKAAQMEKTP
jgi:hypothetical protein